jgi:hypothetical protein
MLSFLLHQQVVHYHLQVQNESEGRHMALDLKGVQKGIPTVHTYYAMNKTYTLGLKTHTNCYSCDTFSTKS